MIIGVCCLAVGVGIIAWQRAVPELVASAATAAVILGVYYALN